MTTATGDRTRDPLPVRLSTGLAGLLVYAYPSHFRGRYGRDLLQNSRDLLRTTYRKAGGAGLLRLWPRLLRDLALGGVVERTRPARVPSPEPIAMFDTLLQDLRYAHRAMRRRPGLSTLAVVTLALGVGASSAMFSVLDAVLLRELPYPDSGRLMSVYTTIPEWRDDPVLGGFWDRTKWSHDEFAEWRATQTAFAQAAVHASVGANLTGLGPASRVRIGLAGPDLLPMLGAVPIHGRLFAPSDRDDRNAVAVVSFGFWQERLGADPAAVGRTVTLDGEPFTVAGVLPDGFGFGSAAHAVWLPIYENQPWGYYPGNTGDLEHLLNVTGRLAPGVTPDQAAEEAARLLPRIGGPDHFTEHAATVLPRLRDLTESVRYPLLVLMVAVLLLLLVACANVATFLLGQAVDRQQEIAVRGALGAGATRIARQLVTESLALAACGGLLGLAIASQGVRALTALAPANLPRLDAVTLDARAVAFAIVATTLSGLLFGLAPALSLSRSDLARRLGAGRFGSGDKSRLQAGMIVGEVALATILLVGAGLLVRSFIQLNAVDPGFRHQRVLSVAVSPDTSPFFDSEGEFQPEAMSTFRGGVGDLLAALPGVVDVTSAEIVPFAGRDANNNVTGEGYDGSDGWDTIASRRFVEPSFHRVMGIELVDGRFLRPDDNRADAARVVLVSESLARRFWQEGEAVGKQLFWWGSESEVVGVVADIREKDLASAPEMTFYAPPLPWGVFGGDYLLAVDGDPAELVGSVRTILATAYPDLVVTRIAPVATLVADSLAEARYRTRLIGVFAAVAVTLSVLGLYAVTSRTVAGRTREIGIRVALGAERGRVVSLLLGDGVRLAGIGAVLGITLALTGTRLIEGFLFGITPYDPVTLIAIGGLVGLLSVLASLLPSLRAARVDTVSALRAD